MPPEFQDAAAGLVAGCLAGSAAATALLLPRLRAASATAASLALRLDEAGAAQVQLAELRANLASLRHDLRGILSPALLIADRLITNTDPAIKRAGEVMIRTVERASARLADPARTQ
jgi:hypothetical protein